ncbi:scaffolding protein [Microbacterium phage Schimmels22]|nr:scaffolding protein [Microbacterium phage Schimmels22]
MAPQEQAETANNDGTEEISDSQDQQQESAEETSDQDQQQDQNQDDKSSADKADKPKPDAAKQALQRDLSQERKDRKAAQARVTELEAQVADLTPKAETGEAWQAKYDRLEAFLQSLGGPISKALDSRSFSHKLFETEDDIEDIVKAWKRDNPTATSSALGSAAAEPAGKKIDPNALLRAARGK